MAIPPRISTSSQRRAFQATGIRCLSCLIVSGEQAPNLGENGQYLCAPSQQRRARRLSVLPYKKTPPIEIGGAKKTKRFALGEGNSSPPPTHCTTDETEASDHHRPGGGFRHRTLTSLAKELITGIVAITVEAVWAV